MENWHDERGKFAQGNPGGPGSIGLHPIQDELEKLTDEQLIANRRRHIYT